MNDSIATMKQNSKEIFSQITANQSQIAQSPLFQESILNVVHQLDVPMDSKVGFYGQIVEQKLAITPAGALTEASLTVVTAMMFLKQSQVPFEQVQPYVQSALQNYSPGETTRALFGARLSKIYPEAAKLF